VRIRRTDDHRRAQEPIAVGDIDEVAFDGAQERVCRESRRLRWRTGKGVRSDFAGFKADKRAGGRRELHAMARLVGGGGRRLGGGQVWREIRRSR
jgi:hypothetical protein